MPDDYFYILSEKLALLSFKKGVYFTVFLLYVNYHSYSLKIQIPSCSTLIKRALKVKKNNGIPNYFANFTYKNYKQFKNTKKWRNHTLGLFKNPYIITPYILFEIVKYKYYLVNYKNISLASYFKMHLGSLKSNGIFLYIC